MYVIIAVSYRVREDVEKEDFITELHTLLTEVKTVCGRADPNMENIDTILGKYIVQRSSAYQEMKRARVLSREKDIILRRVVITIEQYRNDLRAKGVTDLQDGFAYIRDSFAGDVAEMKSHIEETQSQLENLFQFLEEVFSEGQEILVAVTELTVNYWSARFISRYGCEKYFEHNKELLVYERQQELVSEIMLLSDREEIDLTV